MRLPDKKKKEEIRVIRFKEEESYGENICASIHAQQCSGGAETVA